MNIQEYIQSGVVELYVAGALCEEDARELESLAQQYPALRREIEQVEQALEAYSLAHQQEPDPLLKNRILAQVKQSPASPPQPTIREVAALPEETDHNPIPLLSTRTNWLAIAASVLLLLVSAGIGYNFYRKNQQLQSEMAAMRTQTQQQEGLVRQILNDPNYQSLALKGNDKLPLKMPQAEIRVFWHAQTKQVYVSVAQLPELAEDQQYQLWALKNDQPIDAGVFQAQATGFVQSLKTITAADKWAVTVEPKGGSPQPHLDKLCLLSAG